MRFCHKWKDLCLLLQIMWWLSCQLMALVAVRFVSLSKIWATKFRHCESKVFGFLSFHWDRISLYNCSYPGMLSVAQAGLKLAPVLWVLRFQAHTTIHVLDLFNFLTSFLNQECSHFLPFTSISRFTSTHSFFSYMYKRYPQQTHSEMDKSQQRKQLWWDKPMGQPNTGPQMWCTKKKPQSPEVEGADGDIRSLLLRNDPVTVSRLTRTIFKVQIPELQRSIVHPVGEEDGTGG